VLDGGLASLYGIVWATCMWGIGELLFFVVPLVANEFSLSLKMNWQQSYRGSFDRPAYYAKPSSTRRPKIDTRNFMCMQS
jgi:hypothetical protein